MEQRTSTLINARGKMLGRLASRVAYTLQGKGLPAYRPEKREGGVVTVFNVDLIQLSGKKVAQGVRIHHSGYPGGLKRVSVKRILQKDPRLLLKRAVHGMLASNRLRAKLMTKLVLVRGPLDKP